MFCQPDEAYGNPAQAPVTVHLLSKSATLNKIQSKSKLLSAQPKRCLVDEFFEIPTAEREDNLVGSHVSHDTRFTILKAQRHQLEKDVIRLQKQLQQEVDLHYALENAFGQAAGIFTNSPHLPIDAQELLADIAVLELAVLNLEEEMNALSVQLCHEQRERQKAEHRILKFPAHDHRERQKIESRFPVLSVQDHVESIPSLESPRAFPDQMLDSSIPPSMLGGGYNLPPNAICSAKQSCHTTAGLQHSLSPRFCNHYCSPSDSLDSSTTFYTSPNKQLSQPQSVYSSDESGSQCSCHVQDAKAGSWQHGSLFSPEKVKSKISSLTTSFEEATGKQRNADLKNSWRHPNKLSQDMVNCMISIYRHLAYPVDTLSSSKKILSPTSPYGNNLSSSVSSMSESSFLSFTRSPSVDLHNKELGNESSFDPYRTPEKLPWADIGAYNAAIEVSEMCVGKEQLEYAAEALRMFRSLVEQLSRVDPSNMNHEEKLAFWINVYNALMMHAYLAYGVPKNDFKFFSLMQKAAYTVGGHSFNAVVIEHLLLKGKAQWYRPQIALLLAHQKLKLREEVSMFAIDRVEPLVTFGLSFGASSSPAVRVYTAENIQDELQAAFQEYARASVGVTSKGKLLIPKLLYDFGRDLVEESEMLEWICQLLPCQQSNLIRHCAKHRQRGFLNYKHFTVTSFDFRFRYLFLLGPNQCIAQKAM